MVHTLKVWRQWFTAVVDGTKTFEVRVNDRGFKVGDVLVLREFDPETETYSGRSVSCRVTYLMDGDEAVIPVGVMPGYVVMGIKRTLVSIGAAHTDVGREGQA